MIMRPATLADAPTLADLGRSSFCAAFAHLYRSEDLNAFLAQAYAVDTIAREIADPGVTYCLTEDAPGSGLTGYCKLRYPSDYTEYSDAADPIALCQLYTDAARTGEGIGAALMDWALDLAQQQGHDAVQLSVWSENHAAQRFYQRYGFAKIADIYFWVGSHRDDEFLLELRLRKRRLIQP